MPTTLKPDPSLCIRLNFEACITDRTIDSVPQQAGIYVAFVCNKLVDKDGCYRCSRIAYIGKAEGTNNLRNRMQQHFHEDHEYWAQRCRLSKNETFVYTYAVFQDDRLADVESALIYRNQPIVNIQHKDRYNGNSWFLWIICEGNIGILIPEFGVARYIRE